MFIWYSLCLMNFNICDILHLLLSNRTLCVYMFCYSLPCTLMHVTLFMSDVDEKARFIKGVERKEIIGRAFVNKQKTHRRTLRTTAIV